jgi:hypothetical protein
MRYAKMRDKDGKEVYVHRFIAQQMLHRHLRPGEVVDHKDENKLNNRPSNLRVMIEHKHLLRHIRNHDYHKLTKVEMRRGARTTNSIRWG